MHKLVPGAFAVLSLTLAIPAHAQDMRIMTGPQGGVWIPIGGQLKDLWEKAIPGLKVQSLPGAGVANIRGIEEGKTEVGFGNSISTADAMLGNAPFDKKHTKVCNLASLYPQYWQIVVRADSGINSVKDMKGKTLTTQPRGNTAEVNTQVWLRASGMQADVKMSYASITDGIEQMKDGHAQMFTVGSTIPLGAVMDLASARDVRFIDVSAEFEAMKKINPSFQMGKIPAGTYPKQDKDVPVIVYATHLAVSCVLPEAQVYSMTKVVADNVATLSAINKAMEKLTVKYMAEEIGVPFHAGARKFFAEQGIKVN